MAYPTWSKDSRYLYFDNLLTDHPTSRRFKLGSTHSEDSRLYVQDLRTQEIYSLQLQLH
jgi:hypothetical protein